MRVVVHPRTYEVESSKARGSDDLGRRNIVVLNVRSLSMFRYTNDAPVSFVKLVSMHYD